MESKEFDVEEEYKEEEDEDDDLDLLKASVSESIKEYKRQNNLY